MAEFTELEREVERAWTEYTLAVPRNGGTDEWEAYIAAVDAVADERQERWPETHLDLITKLDLRWQ